MCAHRPLLDLASARGFSCVIVQRVSRGALLPNSPYMASIVRCAVFCQPLIRTKHPAYDPKIFSYKMIADRGISCGKFFLNHHHLTVNNKENFICTTVVAHTGIMAHHWKPWKPTYRKVRHRTDNGTIDYIRAHRIRGAKGLQNLILFPHIIPLCAVICCFLMLMYYKLLYIWFSFDSCYFVHLICT